MSNDPAINTALWNFCMKANDGPHRGEDAEALPPRDPKDLEWLKQVMEQLEMPDKTMKRILKDLHKLDADATKKISEEVPNVSSAKAGDSKKPSDDGSSKKDEKDEEISPEELEEKLLDTLDELQELVEDLNFAKEFQLMKGCETVLYKLEGPTVTRNAELRKLLLLTIAHASQNLPDLQESFSKLEWARQLVPMLKNEQNDAAAAANILACGSMCRGSAKASGEFVNAGGFDALFAVLSRNTERAQNGEKADEKSVVRAIRLLKYFLQGRVSSVQIVEQISHFTLPLVDTSDSSESTQALDLRVTATDYMNSFLKIFTSGAPEMLARVKNHCVEKILPRLAVLDSEHHVEGHGDLLRNLQ